MPKLVDKTAECACGEKLWSGPDGTAHRCKLMEVAAERNRYVRARCPICNAVSPVCDQRTDIRRDTLGDWWFGHRFTHVVNPIIERVDGAYTSDQEGDR